MKEGMYMDDKIKIILLLIALAFIAWSVGWFIAQIILMCMEVGG